MAFAAHTTGYSVSAQDQAKAGVSSLFARIVRFMEFRKTVRELQALSDRELVDLGLSRSEIHNVATKATYN